MTTAVIKIGVYSAAPGEPTAMDDPRILDRYIANAGRAPDFVHDYSNVTDPLLSQTEIANLQAHGATPMITWQLFKSGWSGPAITLPDIIAGRYDGYIRRSARDAVAWGRPILLRFAHEMNGNWYPWGRVGSNTPRRYKRAWRHIVRIFRRKGATNVKWVWCPNVDHGQYPFARYFPGDFWVDYVALDGYNWGTSGVGMNKWQSMSEVFSSSYTKLTQISTKPVIIAETSSTETGGDKAAWIRQGLLSTVPQRFPRVAAVFWFDRNMEQDWRINSSSSSLDAYRAAIASPLYGAP